MRDPSRGRHENCFVSEEHLAALRRGQMPMGAVGEVIKPVIVYRFSIATNRARRRILH